MKRINLSALFLLLCLLSAALTGCAKPDELIISGADSVTETAETVDGYERVIAGFGQND